MNHQIYRSCLLFFALSMLLVSCEKEKRDSNEKSKELIVTGAVTDVTEWSAKLSGYVNLTPDLGEVTMGVIYSTEESSSLDKGTVLTSRELDGNDMFTVKASRLSSNSTYYYKSFVMVGGVYRFGEVKQFKTLDISAMVETMPATDVTKYSATLNGKLTLDSCEALPVKGVYFYYSNSIQDASELIGRGTKSRCSISADGIFSSSIEGLDFSTTYYYVPVITVYDKDIYGSVNSFRTIDPPSGSVDLGLSVLWASCNLGASSPEEYGDYYAWGETIPYYTEGHSQDNPCGSWRNRADHPITGYDWTSYKWCNGDYEKLTKYCPSGDTNYWDGEGRPDNKTTFKDYDYIDDAARATLGGSWRIPTKDEFEELIFSCDIALVTMKGVFGLKLTSRKIGYADKWIFLPAAGYRSGTNLYYAESRGSYLSSALSRAPCSWFLHFYDKYVNMESYYINRCIGLSVRPVLDINE